MRFCYRLHIQIVIKVPLTLQLKGLWSDLGQIYCYLKFLTQVSLQSGGQRSDVTMGLALPYNPFALCPSAFVASIPPEPRYYLANRKFSQDLVASSTPDSNCLLPWLCRGLFWAVFLQVITRTSPASLPVFCCSSRRHILRRSSWLQGCLWREQFESSIENTTGSCENKGIHNKEATKQQRGRKVTLNL